MTGRAVPAQGTETLRRASESFKDHSQGQGDLAFVVGALLVAVVLLAIVTSIVPRRERRIQWRFFRRLAEASGLTGDEVRLLQYVAERVLPDDPSAIFVKRSLFEGAVSDLAVDSSRAAVLRQKVYGP